MKQLIKERKKPVYKYDMFAFRDIELHSAKVNKWLRAYDYHLKANKAIPSIWYAIIIPYHMNDIIKYQNWIASSFALKQYIQNIYFMIDKWEYILYVSSSFSWMICVIKSKMYG